MRRKLLITCLSSIVFMINAIGLNPDQIALIPKPKPVQTIEGVLTLKHVFRISGNSTSGIDYARYLNDIRLNGIDYKCINSTNERSEISIRKSDNSDKKESHSLGIYPKGIEIKAVDNAGVLYAIESLKQILVQTWNRKDFNIPCIFIRDERAYCKLQFYSEMADMFPLNM